MEGRESPTSSSEEEAEYNGPYSSPPRFEAAGPLSARPEFQAVKVKAPVGAKVDLMVVRGVQIKDAASGTESEPGILTLNDEHIRFKAAPNDAGDGYKMITYHDEIPREPGPRCTGGTLGGFVKPYVIEVPRQRAGEDERTSTCCHLVFGTNKTACNAFFAKLEEVLDSVALQLNAMAPRAPGPHEPKPETDAGLHVELEPEADPESLPAQAVSDALAAAPAPAADPETLELTDTEQTDPAVTLYGVTCRFSDGSSSDFTKRYRDFHKLRDEIKTLFPSAETWEFPSKQLIGNRDASVIEERREGLQQWCNSLTSEGRHVGPAAWAVLKNFVQSGTNAQQLTQVIHPSPQGDVQYPQDVSAAFDAVFPLLPDRVTVEMLQHSGGGPLYEGFLYKEGRQLKKWSQRFFVLWPKQQHPQIGRILAYFEKNAKTNAFQVKGVIHIIKPVVRAPKTRRPEKFCMRLNANAILGTSSDVPAVNHLVTDNDKKYIIGTDDKQQMEKWVQNLRQCGSAAGGILPNPTEEGWLLIQETGMIRWWKKSWVQLHENAAGDPTLVHYDSSVTWPKGTFNLNQYFLYFPKPTERAREYEIALLPRPLQSRTNSEAELREKTPHYFCAEDQQQFQRWREKLSQKGDEIADEAGEIRYRECREQRIDTSSKYSPPVQVLSHRRPPNKTSAGGTGMGAASPKTQAQGVAHLHDFDILNMLGEGAFGKVLLVRHREERKQYAMKMMLKADIVRGNKEAEVTKELETMISIEHPYIVQVHYAFHNHSRLFLVVDFMPGGELYHHLQQVKRFSEDQARFICAEISLALGYLHGQDMAYRDLKPENVMFTAEGHIRLIDFGLAKWKVSTAIRSTACGTPLYMTPEGVENFRALQDSKPGVQVGTEADWYTLGTLMYELTVGHAPFQAEDQHVLLNKIRTKPVEFNGPGEALSPEAKDVMIRLMDKRPDERLGHRGQTEIQQHAFFSSMDWDLLKQHRATPRYVPPSRLKDRFPSAQLRKDAHKIAGIDDSSSPEDERFAMWQYPRPQSEHDSSTKRTVDSILEAPAEEEDDDAQDSLEPDLQPEAEPEPEPCGTIPVEPEVQGGGTVISPAREITPEAATPSREPEPEPQLSDGTKPVEEDDDALDDLEAELQPEPEREEDDDALNDLEPDLQPEVEPEPQSNDGTTPVEPEVQGGGTVISPAREITPEAATPGREPGPQAQSMVESEDESSASQDPESEPSPESESAAPEPEREAFQQHSDQQFLGIIRHSERLDGLERDNANDLAQDPRCAWPDQLERPYDTPISNFELPGQAALQLKQFGFTRVISSPFRRCLQTAAIVASSLGVKTLDVHMGLGEAMAQVKRNGWPDDPDHELTYLTREGMSASIAETCALAPQLGVVYGQKPSFQEDDVARIRRVLSDISRDHGPMLLVTHGDVLAQWVEVSTKETVLGCDYCGWVVSRRSDNTSEPTTPCAYTTVATDGVTSMLLEAEESLPHKTSLPLVPGSDDREVELAKYRLESDDVEVEFVEHRIGIELTGVDEFGNDLEDGDEPCRYVEVTDVAEGSPASQNPLVEVDMVLKAIAGQPVLGLSTNATIDLLQHSHRPVKIVLGPIPEPLVLSTHEPLVRPGHVGSPAEGISLQPEAHSEARPEAGTPSAETPTPVIDGTWIRAYSTQPGTPHSGLESPAEGIPPVQHSPTDLAVATVAATSPNTDLEAEPRLQPVPDLHAAEKDKELTPTVPLAILAAKAAKEQELEQQSKSRD